MKPTLIAAALCAACGPFAWAAEPFSATPVVLISGGRPTSLPSEIPTTLEGVSARQIEEGINASDSEDALKYLPSLLVRKRYAGDYNHAVLSTRASGTGNSARSMVYADGILLSNFLGNGASFAPRWAMVTPEEIERADVLYGPFSAAYPGNAVGAVVDFQTRMPQRFETHVALAGTVQPFRLYRSDSTLHGRQASIAVGDRVGAWSWYLDLNRQDSEGQPLSFATRLIAAGVPGSAGTPVSGAVADRDRSERPWLLLGASTQYHSVQDHAKLKLAWQLAPGVRLYYLFGLWQNQSDGQAQSYLRDAAGRTVSTGVVNIGGRSYTLSASDFAPTREALRHSMHGLSLKSNTRAAFDYELAASSFGYDRDELRAPTSGSGAGRLVDLHGTGWRSLSAKGIWRVLTGHVIEAGVAQDLYHLASTERATSSWTTGAGGARNQAFAGHTALSGLFAQDAWQFAPDWRAVLGLRLEHWRAWDGVTANASTSVAHPERSAHYASPKAAIGWRASEDWQLKASTGRAVRVPTVSELYQGGVNAAGTLINNDPALQPERSWTTELSAERGTANGGLWRLTAFFERTSDALYAQTNVLVTPNVTNVQNVDRIATHGLETALNLRHWLMAGLDLDASATWTDSRIRANRRFPASVGKWQPRIPEWRATALLTWHPSTRWSLAYGMRYSGRQYSTLDNSDPNGYAYQGASAYFTTDLRARLRLQDGWSIAAGVDNLNNYQYWNFHPYPQRSARFELRYDR
ncbi:TonB-dependent receptor [Massilia sp. TS11]|uniref:TonB-dependent receptor n=1 Tax=Massilia sp. TS11 TaxID=2908003 RepID=UPI001EDAAD57|nr:TonB-dependent receptor [Massilia sp. TS11]MCG2583075.1 TonB-dependent receptor [Massilia sp. TS11]